jgi:hypothetical protein
MRMTAMTQEIALLALTLNVKGESTSLRQMAGEVVGLLLKRLKQVRLCTYARIRV